MSRSKLVAIVMGLCVMGDSMLYTALPASFMDIGLDASITGLILSVNRFARLAFNPLAALVVLRFGKKRTAVLASCLAVVTTLGYSVVQAPLPWLVLRVLWGLTWSLIRLTAFLVTLEDAGKASRGEALGRMQRFVRTGSVLGSFGGGYLLDRVGFRSTAVTLGLVTCLGVVLSLVLKPDETTALRALANDEGPGPSRRGRIQHALEFARSGWAVYGTVLLSAIAVGGIFISTTGVLLRSRMGDTSTPALLGIGLGTLTGFVQASRWLSDILLAPQVGRIADRKGRVLPLAAILALQLLAGVTILSAKDVYATVLASIVMFGSQSFILVVLSTVAADLGRGQHSPLSMTIYSTCLDLGEATGPVLAYSLLGVGLMQTYSVGTGILGLLGALWTARLLANLSRKADQKHSREYQ